MNEKIKGSVVITGASTGIGEATALALDRLGYRVFAGVRRTEDGDALCAKASARLRPIMLDVTRPDQIASTAEWVAAEVGEQGLAALVNNAGVAISAPLEFIPLDDLRWQLEVNVTGQVAVTQAFMPLLRRAKGRIVLMSSVGGRSAAPFVGAYVASKFALEALGDALRVELRPWGMHVALVEPGTIATPIWNTSSKTAERTMAKMPPQTLELYGRALDNLGKLAANPGGISPDYVAKAVIHAVTSPSPRARYVVGNDARIQLLIERLPVGLRDRLFASRFWG
jgi:NAD(P)-dependent dehydrogenase (short-subunit alcohol dehydrogenase family)